MKKISSAILILAFFAFLNCKNNAGELAEAEAKSQAAKDFYHAIIKLGHGFVDVFNAIGGLVSNVFYKADPKKSDVKTYFESVAAILKETQTKIDTLSKEKGSGEEGTVVQTAAKEVSGWLKEMHKAADATAKAGEGGSELIANVAAGGANSKGAGAKADAGSVTGIAQGMKGIVEAAKKAGVELKPEAAGGGNKEAGKLFASGNNANAGVADAAGKAAAAAGKAVSAVSGDQILKAIVDAAESNAGKAAGQATNAVEAAIGDDGDGDGAAAEFGDDKIGKKNDQIAAAIVLRGLAKSGKFANASDADADGKVQAAVKSAVESGVQKTMSSVSNLVKQSILLQLGKVSKAVQDTNAKATSGSGAPKSKSASQNEGGGEADSGSSTIAQK